MRFQFKKGVKSQFKLLMCGTWWAAACGISRAELCNNLNERSRVNKEEQTYHCAISRVECSRRSSSPFTLKSNIVENDENLLELYFENTARKKIINQL